MVGTLQQRDYVHLHVAFSVRIDKGIESHFLTENKEITILT